MTIGIYGIFDSETDECLYVGMSSVSVEDRFKAHLKNLRNRNHPRKDFVEWYHKNGVVPELIVFRVLEECENNIYTLNSLEIKWFNELKPKYFGKRPSLNEKWEHSELSNIKRSAALAGNLIDIVCSECAKIFKGRSATKCLKCRGKIKNEDTNTKRCIKCHKTLSKHKKKYCADCVEFTDNNRIMYYTECINCKARFKSSNKKTALCSEQCYFQKRYGHSFDFDKEILEDMYIKQRLSTHKIAKILQVSAPTIQRKLKNYNIKLRDKNDK